MIKHNRKAGMSISVVLLVFATLALCISAIFIFSVRAPKQNVVFSDIDAIDDFNSLESTFQFYIYEIVREISQTSPSLRGDAFVREFQTKYFQYTLNPALPSQFYSNELKSQIRDESKYKVYFTGKTLKFELQNIAISKDYNTGVMGAVSKMSSTRNISISILLG